MADGGDGIIDPEDEWAGLLGMVSPSPHSPLSPHDFSDDESVEADMPSWSTETLPISGGGVSTTPSPTGFGAGTGSGRRSARSSGSGSSGGRGGGEEDESALRATEARAAATAMFSQLPGTTRPQDDYSGCVRAHHCRAIFSKLSVRPDFSSDNSRLCRTDFAHALRLPQNLVRV